MCICIWTCTMYLYNCVLNNKQDLGETKRKTNQIKINVEKNHKLDQQNYTKCRKKQK